MDDQEVRLKKSIRWIRLKNLDFIVVIGVLMIRKVNLRLIICLYLMILVKRFLGHIYQGYNSTVFAYGQTGSGKSYSI
jgi:hypothetical protein